MDNIIHYWSPKAQYPLMMSCLVWFPSETNLEREIAKGLLDTTNDQEFAQDWQAFLQARIGTPQELTSRAYVSGMAFGGLSEETARDTIVVRGCFQDSVSHGMIDEMALTYHISGNGESGPGMCLDPSCHDRYFREACEYDESGITVNMHKARTIHMDRIR